MELLRAEAELTSSSYQPSRGPSQFVVLHVKTPGVETFTITFNDPVKAQEFARHKQVTVIVQTGVGGAKAEGFDEHTKQNER